MKHTLLVNAARIITQRRILYMKWIDDNRITAAVKGENETYFVTLDLRSGKAWCTCPGYYFRGYCKHIIAVKTYVSRRLGITIT